MNHRKQKEPPRESWREYIDIDKKDHTKGSTPEQLIVFRLNPSDDAAFTRWLNELSRRYGKVRIVSICGSCDDSLLLLTGRGAKRFLKEHTQLTGSPPRRGNTGQLGGTPSGEDGVVRYSGNIKVVFPRKKEKNDGKAYDPPKPDSSDRNPPVTVAVFDTGLVNNELTNFLFDSSQSACIPGAEKGWNFPKSNNDCDDDYATRHGSTVSALTVKQSLDHQRTRVNILRVKIHNEDGYSDLFSVLCGFAYAKERGAQIVNASFGFYTPFYRNAYPETHGILLLKKYVEEYLTKSNILLVAAAGNKVSKSDMKQAYKATDETLPPEPEWRNLDRVSFYPASLARELDNVIAVTTVNVDLCEVSPNQNFSPNVVDIGVHADEPKGFGFLNPRSSAGSFVYGSSFACPVVSGTIASYYHLISGLIPAGQFNKQQIFEILLKEGILRQVDCLATKVRKGLVAKNGRW